MHASLYTLIRTEAPPPPFDTSMVHKIFSNCNQYYASTDYKLNRQFIYEQKFPTTKSDPKELQIKHLEFQKFMKN